MILIRAREPELVMKNCKLLTSNGILNAGLAIDNGKIVAIAKDQLLPKGNSTLNLKGKLVIPGGVDAHVHFKAFQEDWRTASESAASGGVTFVIDHGQTTPPSTNVENLKKMRNEAEKKCIIDFGINGTVTPENLAELPNLAKAGITAFGEVYMAGSVPGSKPMDDGSLLEAFKRIGEIGCVVGVHAENGKIITNLTLKLQREGRNDPLAHLEARPNLAELEAISRALTFARYAGVRLHIYHLTTKEGVTLVQKAKRTGQIVSAETCPHYLLFTESDVKNFGFYLKCNPPIRSEEDRKALWEALRTGVIDMVSTDHYPLMKSHKEKENIWEVSSGMPGVETRIPLLLTFGVKRGLISLGEFMRLVSENPAKTFGIYPKKGTIMIGSDADLAVIDTKKKTKIKSETLHTKSDFTPYEGWEVFGFPLMTFVRGKMIMKEGEIIVEPGYGTFTSPQHTD